MNGITPARILSTGGHFRSGIHHINIVLLYLNKTLLHQIVSSILFDFLEDRYLVGQRKGMKV